MSAGYCTLSLAQYLIKFDCHVTIRSIKRILVQHTMKLSTLETVFQVLNEASVRYLVVGGVAVNIHGYQRMTVDLDLVIQLDSDNIMTAMKTLNQLGYAPIVPVTAEDFIDPNKRKNWIENRSMQVLSLQSNQFPETTIDIFVAEPFNFDKEYESATRAELSPDTIINIVNIPALIEMKKKAGRARDLDDIRHLQIISEEHNGQ